MNAEIVLHQPATDLSFGTGQTFFTDKQIAALRQLGVKDATNGDLAVFFHVAARTGLDPFARQIYLIGRKEKGGETKQTIQTGIDGYRLVARRAADRAADSLEYEDTLWCGPDGAWQDVWLSDKPPSAAKVVVLRSGHRYPAVARWSEYAQTKYDGNLTPMWSRMPANQLAKCAEAAALRKAFPQDLSGVYIDDEIRHDPQPVRPAPQRVTAAEIKQTAPAAAPPSEPKLAKGQLIAIHTAFKQLGMGGDDEDVRAGRLDYIAGLGINVGSTKDLSVSQAATVLDALDERVAALGGE